MNRNSFNFYSFDTNNVHRTNTKKSVSKFIISSILSIILAFVFLYLLHPAFNIKSSSFLVYIVVFTLLFFVISNLAIYYLLIRKESFKVINKIYYGLVAILLLLMFGSSIISLPIFNAKEYAARIDVTKTNFTTIKEVDFTKTAIIDRQSSVVLGDRVMGQMPELVSQFNVASDYTQISYKDSVYRVTPLEYADLLKYIMNRDEGIPAYILVNSTTGEAKLVKLADLGLSGMRYVPSGLLNENLSRKLQLDYPGKIFGSPSFEIDEEGYPYYVCTTYTYKGLDTKKMVDGVVLFDPITGESTYYDDPLDVPSWVDRIYPESLITEELTNYGSLQDGYLNSIFGQKNVYLPSEGYNYLEKDGDIWIYTGLTSVNSDRANLGFAMVNLRNHQAYEIESPGADEISAMRSAEGHVSDFGYNATFPLLVNINNNPVYLMSLKDDAGLIKMYAMVDATDYQKVASVSIDEGLESLKRKFINDAGIINNNLENLMTKTITISDIRFITSNNTTKVYITDTDNVRYKVTVSDRNEDILGFIDIDDTINITYLDNPDIKIINDIKY